MNNKDLAAWLNHIADLHDSRIDLGLERLHQLVEKLGLNQFSIPVIMVAGTNGKGSCVKFLESIYLAAGLQVGAYTSPHIHHFNERLRINNQVLSDEDWINAFSVIEQARGEQTLSFFEYTTLAALQILSLQTLDVIILEVGLGGRLDAVNIVDANVSVVTTIDMDHTNWLGNDRESIATEKSGIFRSQRPAVCGELNPPRAIANIAHEKQAKLFQVGRDFYFEVSQDHWQWHSSDTRLMHLPLPKLPVQNAATSLMVINLLQDELPVTEKAIHQGLQQAVLKGRFEIQHKPVRCIYDVAHNPHACHYLANLLKAHPVKGKTLAVVGMLEDKVIAESVGAMMGQVDAWYIGNLATERAADQRLITSALCTQGAKNCYNFLTIADAMAEAVSAIDESEDDQIVVFGSFYTVAAAQQWWQVQRTEG